MAKDLQDVKKGLALELLTDKYNIGLESKVQVGFSLLLSLASIMCCPVP